MRLVNGVHRALEDAADEMLREHLSGITRPADKADILTPWKEAARKRREIYVSSGVPDPSSRTGMFHRAINRKHPHLNSATQGSLTQHRNRVAGDLGDAPSDRTQRGN